MNEEKATILVVDDEEHIRKLLQYMLERDGFNVMKASTGREALDVLSSGSVDLVLLDIRMPEMDGFQILEEMRRMSDIPVMMVTGTGQVDALDISFELGADDYIKKPFRSDELVARIRSKLRRVR